MAHPSNQPEYSVSEIAGQVKRVVEETFGYVRVRGEISKASVNAASGHGYITMKDDKAVLEAVCWKGTLVKLKHKPQAGMEVIATGRLTTYPGSSKYQLVIEALEPAGIGALMAMLEQRKRALEAEGLFRAERKKPLPFLPVTIGIITSPTGAVIRDILHRLSDRFPRHVLLWPVRVQGQGAAEEIAEAITGFNQLPVGVSAEVSALRRPDLLIVARGGGSIEDLWAFNEEVVVRAAAASTIPLISAVGHETDTTLIDYAADKRAPTPTAAAELAVPEREGLANWLLDITHTLHSSIRRFLVRHAERVEGLNRGLPRPQHMVATMEQTLDSLSERLHLALPRSITARQEKLARLMVGLSPRLLQERLLRQQQRVQHAASMLQSLSVLSVLRRGFVLVRDAQHRVVTSAQEAATRGLLSLQFHDGQLPVRVESGRRVSSTSKKPSQPGLFDDAL